MKPADVFVLTDPTMGRLLDPAVQATVLAKYSRSPLSARELLKSITPEQADAFQLKYGIEWGHSSVQELATLPFCFEGVSIIASKFLEQWQRGAYSEKSTRYQQFSSDCFVLPAGVPQGVAAIANRLYTTYDSLLQPVTQHVASLVGKPVTDATVKARAFDNLRYLLPAGSGTNLACVFNTRDARYVMNSLLGSANSELVSLGQQMKQAAHNFAPVFALGVKPTKTLPIRSTHKTVLGPQGSSVYAEALSENKPLQEAVEALYDVTWPEFVTWMEQRGNQGVPDVFKQFRVRFELTMDYGAFRDLQRHRRCEQYVELLTPHLGFAMPHDLQGTQFESTYVVAMEQAQKDALNLLGVGVDPMYVQYACPLGFMHRSTFEMDLKELYYLTELRTQPQGHISYRQVAWMMLDTARQWFSSHLHWCNAINPNKTGVGVHK